MFCGGRLPGRHHAFFEAIFEIYCHGYHRGRNDPGHSWNYKASEECVSAKVDNLS